MILIGGSSIKDWTRDTMANKMVEYFPVKDTPEEAAQRVIDVQTARTKLLNRPKPKAGYSMTPPWVFTKIHQTTPLQSPDECHNADDLETIGDGGCNWGRSHATVFGGKHSLRNASNRQDYQREMAARLARPTHIKPTIKSEPFPPDPTLLELASWDIYHEEMPTVVIQRRLVWR